MSPRRLLFAALAAACLGWAAPAVAKPPIWTVKGPGGATVTLFGSVHLLSDSVDWTDPELDHALHGAGRLLFEVPLDAAAQSAAGNEAMAKGLLPQEQSLSALLSPEARARLPRVAAARRRQPGPPGAPAALAGGGDPLHPLFPEARGQGRARRGEDHRRPHSRDRRARRAGDRVRPDRRAVRRLEGRPGEIPGGDPARDRAGAGQLRQAGRRLGARATSETIEREGLDDLRRNAPGAFQRLVADRNAKWAPEIEALLKGGDDAVVVVGVGHLVGAGGVPALLRRDGYAVVGP